MGLSILDTLTYDQATIDQGIDRSTKRAQEAQQLVAQGHYLAGWGLQRQAVADMELAMRAQALHQLINLPYSIADTLGSWWGKRDKPTTTPTTILRRVMKRLLMVLLCLVSSLTMIPAYAITLYTVSWQTVSDQSIAAYRDGHYPQALALAEQALAIAKATEPARIPMSWRNLGWLHVKQGHYEQAEQFYQQALSAWLKTYSPTDIRVGLIWDDLAMVYEEQGQLAKAEIFEQQAIPLFRAEYGADSIKLAYRLNNLAGMINH